MVRATMVRASTIGSDLRRRSELRSRIDSPPVIAGRHRPRGDQRLLGPVGADQGRAPTAGTTAALAARLVGTGADPEEDRRRSDDRRECDQADHDPVQARRRLAALGHPVLEHRRRRAHTRGRWRARRARRCRCRGGRRLGCGGNGGRWGRRGRRRPRRGGGTCGTAPLNTDLFGTPPFRTNVTHSEKGCHDRQCNDRELLDGAAGRSRRSWLHRARTIPGPPQRLGHPALPRPRRASEPGASASTLLQRTRPRRPGGDGAALQRSRTPGTHRPGLPCHLEVARMRTAAPGERRHRRADR